MRIKDVWKLQARATRGDRASQEALIEYNDKVAREVNKRLRGLERRGYDYGGYNTPTHFTQTMYETNRFKLSRNMDNDFHLMATQTKIGLKFLEYESSTVEGQRAIERRRFESFIDMGIVDEDFSPIKFRNFLKFLGNEESEKILESWSTSDVMVQVLFDAYNRRENTKKKMLKVFNEYLSADSTNKDIFQTMKKLGIDLHEYRKIRWDTW